MNNTPLQGTNTMVELDEFSVTRNDFFTIGFLLVRKKGCLVFAYGAAIGIALGVIDDNWIGTLVGILVILILMPIILYIKILEVIPSSKDTHFYQKRKLSFDADKFHVQAEDGSKSHILLSHIVRANRLGGYYYLFFDKVQSYPIPITAFRSEEDRIRFETEILGDKLKRKAMPWKATLIFLLISACLFGTAFAIRPHVIQREDEVQYDQYDDNWR